MILIKKIREIIEILKPSSNDKTLDQREHIAHMVQVINERAIHSQNRTGMILACLLPADAVAVMMKSPIDPYTKHLNRYELTAWMNNHLVFDEYGVIVCLHDHGKILWRKEGWLGGWRSRI